MLNKIKDLSNYHFQSVVEDRHHFHRHPELSGEEKNTAKYICKILDELEIPYRNNIAGHGIVALLRGKLPGDRIVAIRADMDALPLNEISDKSYRSEISGVMHACGHDVHIACVLGCLRIMNDLRNHFGGIIKAIFQPSEESYDGGASYMIEEGVLNDPEVNIIFGQHVTPGIETGYIGLREGAFMASTDEIHLHIRGKGGHAALVHETVNPVNIGMAILQKAQDYVKKEQPEDIPTVLSFGRFIANGLTNLIPDEAQIAGTLRTFDENWRNKIVENIERIATETAKKEGGECEVTIKRGYPVLVNDPDATQRVKHYAKAYLGKEYVIDLPYRMTAEDFAYYLQKKTGVFYRLGTSNSTKGITQSLHSKEFDIDEEALKIGMGLLSWISYNELSFQK